MKQAAELGWLITQEHETQGCGTKNYTAHAAIFESTQGSNCQN